MSKFKVGDICYLMQSKRFIREGRITRCSGNTYTFNFIEGGAINVSESRLYKTEAEVQAELDRLRGKDGSGASKIEPQKFNWL